MTERWTVIRVGQTGLPGLNQWCVFHPPGPPNSNHPHTTDEQMAHRIAAMLNRSDHPEQL